jgi:hypothetical protein
MVGCRRMVVALACGARCCRRKRMSGSECLLCSHASFRVPAGLALRSGVEGASEGPRSC